jgi:hypothetical protein
MQEHNKRLAKGNVRPISPLEPMAPAMGSLAHIEEPWCKQAASPWLCALAPLTGGMRPRGPQVAPTEGCGGSLASRSG